MQIFAYAPGWADLVVAQLAVSHNTERPDLWGYACLCIGRNFDALINEYYEEIDYVTGSYLHVFSMLPPPRLFFESRISLLKQKSDVQEDAVYLKQRLTSMQGNYRSLYAYDDPRHKQQLISEKVRLLKDLASAGLRADQYADFLFFNFGGERGNIDIDVIAAKQSPIGERASHNLQMAFFERLGKQAEKHYLKQDSVETFVKSLGWEWSARIALQKALNLKTYIDGFLKGFT